LGAGLGGLLRLLRVGSVFGVEVGKEKAIFNSFAGGKVIFH
jgi:hypothetical protein